MSKRLFLTGVATVAIVTLLCWQHFHGGVPAHHILQKKELPAISNWWGALLLPLLTWFLLGRVKKRVGENSSSAATRKSWYIFAAGLFFGIALAVAFTLDYKLFLDNVPYILLALGLIIPIFYAEFILGFVLGMSYTFGAILPTAFVLIMAGLGYVLYRFLRPLLLRLIGRKL